MLIFLAQEVAPAGGGDVFGSAGLLGAIIGGSLLASVIAAYRFAVNFRTTERGMRARAARDKRLAQHEAGLWQARCADLEYELRRRGHPVPKLNPELQQLVNQAEDGDIPLARWDDSNHPPIQPPEERLGR